MQRKGREGMDLGLDCLTTELREVVGDGEVFFTEAEEEEGVARRPQIDLISSFQTYGISSHKSLTLYYYYFFISNLHYIIRAQNDRKICGLLF